MLCALAIPAMADVRVEVDDQQGRADRVPVITVGGLAVAEAVRLRLSMQDSRGQRWQSEAVLRADLDGQVDTARSGSEQGSYRGIDASGLIWSMQPQQGRASALPLPWRRAADGMGFLPQTFELEVERAGSVVARRTLQRHLMLPGVQVQRVEIGGREAHLYLPADLRPGARVAAMVTLGGAEGGFEGGDMYAAWLASNGYVALSIAWYRGPGVPKDLIDVPLETVRDAVHWLQRHPGVEPQRVGLLGGLLGWHCSHGHGNPPADPAGCGLLGRESGALPWHCAGCGSCRFPGRGSIAAELAGQTAAVVAVPRRCRLGTSRAAMGAGAAGRGVADREDRRTHAVGGRR
ncbi:acyl-CoA thioesterase/BAAT N-terminal domain-containing protein [Stenotrophomonas maltophilia]|uniref:acyl-CoA thioesterase/BAAT N-terminal domain-containing protein n=1 Tax=Stenotrophomonas maltophilia TaxID=40324 RepID=UPI003D18EE14